MLNHAQGQLAQFREMRILYRFRNLTHYYCKVTSFLVWLSSKKKSLLKSVWDTCLNGTLAYADSSDSAVGGEPTITFLPLHLPQFPQTIDVTCAKAR